MEDRFSMMEPPIDELVKIVGNKFLLTSLISARAKEISNQYFSGEPSDSDPKVISIATREIYEGKVKPNKTM